MKFKEKIVAPIKIIKIISKYEPLYLIMVLPQIIISSMLPLLYIYFPKLFIEQLTSGNDYLVILKMVLLYISLLLVMNAISAFLSNKTSFHVDRFFKKMRQETGDITMSMPLEIMEGAEFRDKLTMANNITQITGVADLMQKIISSIITIIGLSMIIIHLDIIFVLLVCTTLAIKIWFVYLTFKHNEKRRKLYAANNRIGDYLNSIAYFNQGAAKELRINNLKKWFMGKIRVYRNEMLLLQYGDFKRNAFFESITAVIVALQSLVILYVLAVRFIDDVINIADFTMYFNAIATLTITLSAIVGYIGEYNRQQLNLSDFSVLEQLSTKAKMSRAVCDGNIEIVFDNVSFRYPNAEKLVLENINIRIAAGEKLSVVGLNGAGKSTFIKLLCKFYRPTSGEIRIGGRNIWDIDNNEYNHFIAAVFQDYQNFSFTVGENVSMGKSCDNVIQILRDIGLDKILENLPDGINTYLSRNFDTNGVELSGGEGQKLAIARAVYKNTPILILDEPTASLDPKSESEIYDNFFKVSKNKTTIFISHRLASSTRADIIVVFENGKIVEQGAHKELLKNNKKYAEMFNMQKESYIN